MPSSRVDDSSYQRIFEALPNQYIVVDRERRVVAATDSFLAATMKVREKVMGRDILDVFPDNPDDPTADGTTVLRESIEKTIEMRETVVLKPQRYDMERSDGTYEIRYWQPMNAPVLDDAGEVLYVMHGAEDVTARVLAKEA